MTVRGSLPLLLLLSCFTFTFFFVSQSLWTSQSQTDSSASSSYESMDITPSFYYVDQVYDQTDENPVVTDKDVIGISEVGDKTLHRGQMWSETKALEQEEIRTRINRVCQARGSSLTMSIKKVIMMVDPTHKIAFCRHAKVGLIAICTYAMSCTRSHSTGSDLDVVESLSASIACVWGPKTGLEGGQSFTSHSCATILQSPKYGPHKCS